MNNKTIKNVEFVLENCETVIVSYGCFEQLIINNGQELKNKDTITNLECIIKDTGNIEYGSTWSDNKTSPIERLSKYNDITQIEITYIDDSKEHFYVQWYDEDPNSNKNQNSILVDYRILHINIKPHIHKTTVTEIFDYPEGTRFKGDDNNIYEISENEKGKYIENMMLEEAYMKMGYTLVF